MVRKRRTIRRIRPKLQEGRHTTEIASSKNLYTEVNVHVRELKTLSHPVDSLGAFIVTFMLKRMPRGLVKLSGRVIAYAAQRTTKIR